MEELADVEDAKQVEEDDGAARFDQPPSLSSCKRMLKDVDWETSPDGGYEVRKGERAGSCDDVFT